MNDDFQAILKLSHNSNTLILEEIYYLKFHAMNDDFQAILKLSHNSNALILDKV